MRHGYARRPRTPEYRAWAAMKTFCLNKKDRHYKDYGARGITICEDWMLFENFIADVGPRPASGYVLGRIDVNKGYYPKNCRWTLNKTQQNRRRDNIVIAYQGRRLTMKQWAEKTGVSYATLFARLRKLGWSTARALKDN